ncbi:MAG: YlbF family regulator [Bacilli bacterium]|nr:YlbF family regulator [Bacilli bacterium]
MNKDIYEISSILKQALDTHRDIVLLNQYEKDMEDDEEAQKLSYLKDMAVLKYNDMLKIYSSESNEIKPFINELSKCKESLQTHPKVAIYLKQFSKVKQIYNEINNILFANLSLDTCKRNNND